ncbi:MAG TPA: DinB family protein [Vicinamibacterales bacterium]|nr:DinB family protein [Vicinamibacterales bacterium]
MTADQAKAVAETVGQQLQHEWMTTFKVLTAVPEAKRDYKPDSNSRSAWDLASHIAGADVWFLDSVINGKFENPSDQAPAPNVEGLGNWYKKEMPNRLERVMALDGNKLTQIIEFHGMKMPAAQILLFTLVHMVHHRGQLAAYLRPMGAKVPSIYGGSHDEQWQGAKDANA